MQDEVDRSSVLRAPRPDRQQPKSCRISAATTLLRCSNHTEQSCLQGRRQKIAVSTPQAKSCSTMMMIGGFCPPAASSCGGAMRPSRRRREGREGGTKQNTPAYDVRAKDSAGGGGGDVPTNVECNRRHFRWGELQNKQQGGRPRQQGAVAGDGARAQARANHIRTKETRENRV